MVRGLDKFKEYFAGFDGNYVLIGGAASNLLEEENRLVPRATKDLDIILVVEALTSSFVKRFWQFVRDAGYVHRQKGTDRSELYRFYQPTDANYPAQLELLSRKPDLIELPKDIVIGSIPVGEELSSLSAIMLNDEYYHFTIANSIIHRVLFFIFIFINSLSLINYYLFISLYNSCQASHSWAILGRSRSAPPTSTA